MILSSTTVNVKGSKSNSQFRKGNSQEGKKKTSSLPIIIMQDTQKTLVSSSIDILNDLKISSSIVILNALNTKKYL